MTVIATGFAGGKKGKNTTANDLLDAMTDKSSDDDDDYVDLMNIFSNK